jgi:hypothetical protein
MQINGKDIQNLFVNMVVKKTLKIHKFKEAPFHVSSLWEWAKKIPI